MSIAAKTNITGNKNVKLVNFKTSASRPTDEQLLLINQFTRRPFVVEELYCGTIRLCHNLIDRDDERFSEEVLARFAATAIRKTVLFDHGRNVQQAGLGKIYSCRIEKMPMQQAMAETGEYLQLPPGIVEIQFLDVDFFIPIKGVTEDIIVKLDSGVYDYASVGFRAKDLVPIMDKDGKVLFREYRGTGPETEVTEASIVYLGAQPGASIKSADSSSPDGDKTNPPDGKGKLQEGGEKAMEKFLKMLARLFPGKTFTEDGVESELRAAMAEDAQKSLDAAVKAKNDRIMVLEPIEAEVILLRPLAADGKAYRDGLVQTYVTQKAKLEECAETPEAQDALKKVVAAYPVDFLKSEVAHLEKRVAEKFPDKEQLASGADPEQRDKSKGAAAGKKHPLDPNK